jgi:hypothetical protein
VNRSLQLVIDTVQATRADLVELVEPLAPETVAARPLPDAWSPGEILEHLAIVEKRVLAGVSARIGKARGDGATGAPEDKTIEDRLRAFDPAIAGRRLTAPPEIAPSGGLALADLLAMLTSSRAALVEVVSAAEDLPLDELAFPHPVFGDLALLNWVLFVGLHEKRHATQIRRALGRGVSA